MGTLLMKTNFLAADVVSNATVSSEQSAFLAENLYNAQRRSKVWRSDGYWEITTGNNVLTFQETSGVDLTAALTVGTYASSDLLIAEIKSKMDGAVAAASTYTIVQEADTFRFKFTSNGVGGTGLFTLRWSLNTTLAAQMGFDTPDDTGALTYTADTLRLATEEWIKWDMGISTNPQAFIMIGPRNEPLKIAPSSVLKLQANETDAWSSPSYETTLTYNGRAIIEIDTAGLHTEALRYWRLEIDDLNNPQGFVELGACFLGDYFEGTRGKPQFPFRGGYVDRSPSVTSEGGQVFSDIREKTEKFQLEWFGLTVAEKEDLDTFFDDFGVSQPFFIVFDSETAFSSSSNYYVRYCKFSGAPNYQLVSPGNYQMSMELLEQL
ncbi:hypothetical protein DRH27_01570 [Candidatus Falkowbacteria bacterium]|nr:MAG: hypothetical protein DRH27_01570 [Candidatus Falkowbacteria bacterium]